MRKPNHGGVPGRLGRTAAALNGHQAIDARRWSWEGWLSTTYIFKEECFLSCCTNLADPPKNLLSALPCVYLFRNISLPSDLYPQSQLQYRISLARLTYINREDLDTYPHRSNLTSRAGECTHFLDITSSTAFGRADHREHGFVARYRASVDNQQLRGHDMAGYLHNRRNRPWDRWL